jgi:hypothetical protein
MHDTIAGVFSVALTILGLSYIVQARAWARLYVEFDVHPKRFIPTGLLLFAAGLYVALNFDDWSDTWPIFITVFGWLMAIEGVIILISPSLLTHFTRVLGPRLRHFVRLGGFRVLGLGALLVWENLLQHHF